MKKKLITIIIVLLVLSNLTACITQNIQKNNSPSSTKPRSDEQILLSQTIEENQITSNTSTPTNQAQDKLSVTPTKTEIVQPTSTSTSTPSTQATEYSSYNFSPIFLGEELIINIEGLRKVSLKIDEVIQGKEASDMMIVNWDDAPNPLEWIVVKLKISYLEGPKDERISLIDGEDFELISNGQVMFYDHDWHPDYDSFLIPGESSRSFMGFQRYADDACPLLRFSINNETNFFSLCEEFSENDEWAHEKAVLLENESGSENNPVPYNTSIEFNDNGTTLVMTVKNNKEGFSAWKALSDILGWNDPAPEGYEYIIPYLVIEVKNSDEEIYNFPINSLSIFAENQSIQPPDPLEVLCFNLFCLEFGNEIYRGGKVETWIPLYSIENSKNPLLVFDNRIYFSLSPENQVDNEIKISPDAIGYENISNLSTIYQFDQKYLVNSLAFSPDNKFLASGSDDKNIYVWEIGKEEPVILTGHTASVKDVHFSSDGQILISTAYTNEIFIWDTSTWEMIQNIDQAGKGLFAEFLLDGTIVTGNREGHIFFYDLMTIEVTNDFRIPTTHSSTCRNSPIYNYDVSLDGTIIAAAQGCGYGVFVNLINDEKIVDFNYANDSGQIPYISTIAVSPNGETGAYGSVYYPRRREVYIDILGLQDNESDASSIGTATTNIACSTFSPNNEIYIAGIGSVVRAWWPDIYIWGDEHVLSFSDHKAQITAIEFSPDGALLATGDYSGNIIIWEP